MKTKLLLLVLVIGTSALAQTMGGGDGTQANPFKISNSDDWTALKTAVTSANPPGWPYVELTNDVSLSAITDGYGLAVGYGTGNQFKGVFDGKGFKLTDVNIGTSETPLAVNGSIAPFSAISGATIKNLEVNVAIYSLLSSPATGAYSTFSGLVGGTFLDCTIQNCKVTGTVQMTNSAAPTANGSVRVGGIVGNINNNGVLSIINCSTNLDLKATSSITTATLNTTFCGGILAFQGSTTKVYIINSSTAGSVYAKSTTAQAYAGGLVGQRPVDTNDFQIINCMASNTVEAYNSSASTTTGCFAGGLIGQLGQNNTAAIVKNNMALNPSVKSITYSSFVPTLNRISLKTASALFTDNYAKSDMTLTAKQGSSDGNNGTPVTITVANDPTDGNGGNLGLDPVGDATSKLNTYLVLNPTFNSIALVNWSGGNLTLATNSQPEIKLLNYNISNGILNVNGINGSKQLSIYNISGAVCKQLVVTDSYSTSLEKGIYILKAEGFKPSKLVVY